MAAADYDFVGFYYVWGLSAKENTTPLVVRIRVCNHSIKVIYFALALSPTAEGGRTKTKDL